MIHLGDITKIDWASIPPVDCVTGGSPCQDLSLAGKREGLAGERSGLFMVQIDGVKELRKADELRGRTGEFIRPRWMVWENVPGAFSSNQRKDFAAVLTEIVRVKEPEAPPVPVPSKGWPHAGLIYDELGGWSIAWRLHNAQHWGVPQRRKRISLVADFGGLRAGEILFEPESLSGYPPQSREAWQEATGGSGEGSDGTGEILSPICLASSAANAEIGYGFSPSLLARAGTGGNNQRLVVANEPMAVENHPADSRVKLHEDGICQSLTSRMGTGGGNVPMVMEQALGVDCYNQSISGCISKPLTSSACDSDHTPCLLHKKTVRRLTPLECERLQGYPDGWTDIGDWVDSKGKTHKCTDSHRYKALGNSIALPFWRWMLRRISNEYPSGYVPTLGSLFDGIGGFPYIWEGINGHGTALWASEIEDFPIAVTKKHFP